MDMDSDKENKKSQHEVLMDNDKEVVIEDERDQTLLFKAADHPPLYLTLFCGFQHVLVSLSSIVAMALLIVDVTCANLDEDLKTTLLSSSLFMCGICTMLMSFIGSRMPLIQGSASDFLIPLLAMQVLDPEKCTIIQNVDNVALMTACQVGPMVLMFPFFAGRTNTSGFLNYTINSTVENKLDFVLNNIRELQGSLIAAGTCQFLIGSTGLISLLLQFIGPITIVPTLFLSSLFGARAAVKFAKFHWGVAILVVAIAILLSLYLSHKNTPIPFWTKTKGFHIWWFPLHQVYSILIAMVIGWIVSGIMTAAGAFAPDDTYARTDLRLNIISEAPWFKFPYPGQFGPISFSVSVFTGFMIGTMTSILDSIGDYYACAKMCNLPPPPKHAVNRGIAVEGFCSLIAGFLGCGHGTSTYGGNIGAIGVTRVASRDVFITTGLLYVILGLVGKFSAVFLTIPYPVLGGAIIILFGMFNGVVLSNLHVVSLSSTRNMAIIGTSIMFGMMIPYFIETTPDAINTGSETRDGVIKMLLVNPNLCGGVVAFFLDNTIRGTLEERGIAAWQKLVDEKSSDDYSYDYDCSFYDIPIPDKWKRSQIIKRLPLFPSYKNFS